MKNICKHILLAVCAAWSCYGLTSCNKYSTPLSVSDGVELTDTVSTSIARKVLWVNIDGAVGSIMKQQTEQGNLPTVKEMLAHSKYAWLGLADGRENESQATAQTEEDPLTWASMLTGVSSTLHFIKDTSYLPDFPLEDNPLNQDVNYFPSLIQHLTKLSPTLQTACVTPWRNLNRYLGDANSVTTTASDEETLSTLFGHLSNADYDFELASFKGALEAGKQGGFTADNQAYTAALATADGYLKQLLEAIATRKEAELEDWLVIVTSNQGGTADGHVGGTSAAERDIFGLFYYPHYTEFEMKGEYLEAARFDRSVLASILDTMAYYELDRNALSFEFNIRMLPKADGTYSGGNWDRVVGKDRWGVSRQRSTLSLRANAEPPIEQAITGANDSQWHSFYFGFGQVEGSVRRFYCAYDGVRVKSEDTENGIDGLTADSTYLYIGKGNLPNSYYVSTLRLYNKIIDDVYVSENASLWNEMPEENATYGSLIGEWVLTQDKLVQDTIIPNRIAGMPDLHFNKVPAFIKQANTLPAQLKSGNLVMENTLVAPQIIYWLYGASGIDSRMEGYNFLAAYALEEQWRDYVEE